MVARSLSGPKGGGTFPIGNALAGMKVVNLSRLLRLTVPSLYISSIPKNAIGFSFESGRFGLLVGASLLASSMVIGFLLSGVVGPFGFPVALWLFGSTGAVMLYNSAWRSVAFVKPLCSRCRLLPVIVDHEALHLGGLEGDADVWQEMKKRYSCESLSIEGDATICSFCPIPKRLEH